MNKNSFLAIGVTHGGSYSFGHMFEIDHDRINLEESEAYDEYEIAPFKNQYKDGLHIIKLVENDQYYVGTKSSINEFLTYFEARKFGVSCYTFKDGYVEPTEVFNLVSEEDLIINGYHIRMEYGLIRIYQKDNTEDMYIVLKNIIPGSKHVVYFPDKTDEKLFTDFINRYDYVNYTD